MRHERLTFGFLFTFWLAVTAGAEALAQDRPAVQVDMSVLEAMQPASGRDPYYPAPPRPVLTREPSAPAVTPPARHEPAKAVSFPITVKERSEVFDPALQKSVASREPVKEARPVKLDPPLPPLKPVAIANRQVKVPLPPRRPAIQRASSSFVAQARNNIAVSDLSKPAPEMPAVPPKTVDMEPLKPPPGHTPIAGDALAQTLLEPGRQEMVEKVGAISKLAASLAGDTTTDVPLPPEKPVIENPMVAKIEEALDITAVEPAAGVETASLIDLTADIEPAAPAAIPRVPPPENDAEKEYVSLPFPEGAAELDQNLTTMVEREIIPLLQSNPGWRVQIQAFASETDNALKGARRMSLSRALSIRSYLLDQGIEARRMDVRALGTQTDRNPADRVDFVFFNSNINQ